MERTLKTKQLIEHMLNELGHPIKDLTKWEDDFVSSLNNQFDTRGTLSDKQFEILERIYAEKTA